MATKRPRLPPAIAACLFDLDGVLTRTAKVHAMAWKEMFDAFLRERAARTGDAFRAFDIATDYAQYVDGRLRADGVREFLASRGVVLPDGDPADPPDVDTVNGLANRKNEVVLELIRTRGVETYPDAVAFVEVVRAAGLRSAVVSASKNTAEVLQVTGIAPLFEERVDGELAEREDLPGKPAPDMFLAAARLLHTEPARCAVFEDAIAGVEAGRAGSFGYVVGVDRVGRAAALREHGADVVVQHLDELVDPA